MSRSPLFLAILALAVASLALAQPQAPITWSEHRWFNIWHAQEPWNILLLGDTLVFSADSFIVSQGFIPIVSSSRDNGQTFSSWQRLDNVPQERINAFLCGSAGLIYAFGWRSSRGIPELTGWGKRSVDGGANWATIQPPTFGTDAFWGLALGSQVIRLQWRSVNDSERVLETVTSDDAGDTWHNAVPVQFEPETYGFRLMAATRSRVFLLGGDFSTVLPKLVVATSDRAVQTWTPFRCVISDQSYRFLATSVVGDTMSEIAGILGMRPVDEMGNADLYVVRTADGGETWEPPLAVITGGHVYAEIAQPQIFSRDKLWGFLWENFTDSDPTRWGVYLSLSANHGRDWYPPSRVGFDFDDMSYSGGQFVGNEVRGYWNGSYHTDYGTVSGALSADTIRPSINAFLTGPDTLRIGDTLDIHALVTENDTISAVRLFVQSLDGSPYSALMQRAEGHEYLAYYVVPIEGSYRYRIEAEDFWENIGTYPDTDWATFTTGPLGTADLSLQVSSFGLRAFPNPFNPTTTISFSLPHAGEASVKVFDVTGRLARVLVEGRMEAGEHSVVLDGSGMASGIYFVRMESAGRVRTLKIVMIK